MVFSSPTFLFAFLPLTLIGVALLRRRWLQNSWLLAMSVLFYLWGAGAIVVVIGYVTLVSFVIGLQRWERLQPGTARFRVALAGSVLAIIAPLLFFKYIPPLATLFSNDAFWASIVLPLGISFFTFHALSYLFDVARGRLVPEHNLRDYALYLFVFPHQIAGPIVRYSEIQSELREGIRIGSRSEVALGLARFVWGLSKKVLVADPCGRLADSIFHMNAGGTELSALDAWAGALLYALQIYFDFSGYSDMAIGLALILGFRFPENFFQPYRSISITDFWRRWHVTLSRWFRDYVYIPMGGSRHGLAREVTALLTVFLLTSLWHGASLTFLLWGGLHSGMLLIERFTGLRDSERFPVIRRALIFVFIVASWVPFRAGSIDEVWTFWGAMFVPQSLLPGPALASGITPFLVVAVTLGIVSLFGPRRLTGFATVFGGRAVSEIPSLRWPVLTPAAAGLAVIAFAAVLWSDFSPFLYFQF